MDEGLAYRRYSNLSKETGEAVKTEQEIDAEMAKRYLLDMLFDLMEANPGGIMFNVLYTSKETRKVLGSTGYIESDGEGHWKFTQEAYDAYIAHSKESTQGWHIHIHAMQREIDRLKRAFRVYEYWAREREQARRDYGCNKEGIAISQHPAAKRWQACDFRMLTAESVLTGADHSEYIAYYRKAVNK
jgi:hypothetical protein